MRFEKAFCDHCGKEDFHHYFPVQLSGGYGSIFDEMQFDFCSDECCLNFIKNKLNECKANGGFDLPLRIEFEKKIHEIRELGEKGR